MTDTRRCVGSTRFGIEAHDAPIEDFSVQASQKDGLSRMCTTHWKAYVAGLAREAKERKAATVVGDANVEGIVPEEPPKKATRSRPKAGAKGTVARESAAE